MDNYSNREAEALQQSGFMAGGGEMGMLMRSMDWSASALGPVTTWPQSLRTMISALLNSRFPMFIFWGPDSLCFYNDAYRPSLGNNGKHPHALGQPGAQVWPEIWHIIYPLIEQVLSGGEAIWSQDQLIPIYRNGKLEDVYWSFSYSAIKQENGQVGGVLVVCTETTGEVKRKRDMHKKLAFAIEAAELASWDYDLINEQFTANDRYKQWLGQYAAHGPDNYLGLTAVALHERERVMQAYSKALDPASGGRYDTEYTLSLPGCSNRTVKAKGKAWFDEQGKPYRLTGTLQDITSQVDAVKKLEKSEQQIRSIIESNPYPIAVYLGRQMQIQFANKAILDIWGKGEQVTGKLYREVLPELETQHIFEQLESVFDTGRPFHANGQHLDLVVDGKLQTFYFNYSFTPLFDAEGNVYGIVNTGADVTDLMLAHNRIELYAQELKESEERFRIMADAAPNMVWSLNPDGSIKYVNSFALNFLGTTLKEIIEQGWSPYTHLEDIATVEASIRQATEQGAAFSVQVRMRYHDGQYRWMLTQGAPSYYSNGELYGYVGSGIDITDRKAAEEALDKSNRELLRINNDLDNFIYTASHDLRAPISNIEGLLQALLRTLDSVNNLPPRALHITSLMQDSVERFKKTIANLTEVVKLQKEYSGQMNVVALDEVIKEVCLDLTPLLESTDAYIATDLDNCPQLMFSEKNLRSIVYNLISNAIKYRAPDRKPKVSISSHQKEDHILIAVEDNGLGIAPDRIGQLFSMFRRFHDHVEGSGIGLYMIKKIVDNAGGRIEVESKLGKGSIFRVYLPTHL